MDADQTSPADNVTSAANWKIPMDFPILGQKFSLSQHIFQSSLAVFGILLNGLVFSVVSLSRQLRYPRHIFWAAISFFECIFLVQVALEIYIIIQQDRLTCQPYIILAASGYSVLLVCISLGAFDRYLAIAKYEWYKKTVTNRGVIVSMAVASTLTLVIITSPFWTGYLYLSTCTLNLAHIHWVLTWDLFLGIVCVIVHYKIFIESKKLIQQHLPNYRQEPITVKFVNTSARPSNLDYGRGEEPSQAAERVVITFPVNPSIILNENTTRLHFGDPQMASYVDQFDADCFPWIPIRSKVNRLEVRAALSMSVNILPFWLSTFPVSCNVMTLYWCVRLDATDCAINSIVIYGYLWNLFMLHSIYNPIMYMSTSSEFRRAVLHITRKLMNTLRIRNRGN